MVWAFFWISIAIAVIVIALALKINNVKHEMTRLIQYLYICASACILLNAIEVISLGETISMLLHGMYLAATDWLVIVLLVYVRRYTGLNVKKWFVIVWCVFALADTASLIINTYTEHVFDNSLGTIGNRQVYAPNLKYPMYFTHIAVAYIPALIVLGMLVYKYIKTIKTYRTKYRLVLLTLIVIMVANIVCTVLDFPFDISPVLYAGLAIAICYFTLYYVPHGLVVGLLTYALRGMDNGIMCFDRSGKCIYANTKIKQLFHVDNDLTRFEKNFEKWKNGRDIDEIGEQCWKDKKVIDGKTVYYHTTFKPLLDEKGNHVGCFFMSEDRTCDVLEAKRQRYRAIHDKLTDIYNRDGFIDSVTQTIEKNPDTEFTMVCTDIKDFKLVNELFGEKRGDEILIQIAEFLKNDTTEGTIYGRLGTDRFAIFMRSELFKQEMYVDYVTRLSKFASNDVYHMIIHVGVYENVNKKHSVASMCDRAMLAISKIKNDYQQIVAYYDEELSQNKKNENQLISEFDRALEQGEFHMFLQPQVSKDHKMHGAEALTRWLHPDDGMISPASFIPLFERVSLIHMLDMYIWEQACKKLSEWKEQGNENLYISVNISPKDFYLVDIYTTLTRLVEKYGISPQNLRLEITETALMADINKQIELIEKLRAYGFVVEIDDFGSGYSSLNTLKDIRADILKLDMGFLSKTAFKERSDAVIDAIVALSKQLGLSVISEGVETIEQVDFLTRTGCDMFQGYYFAKPMPVDEFENKYMKTVVAE